MLRQVTDKMKTSLSLGETHILLFFLPISVQIFVLEMRPAALRHLAITTLCQSIMTAKLSLILADPRSRYLNIFWQIEYSVFLSVHVNIAAIFQRKTNLVAYIGAEHVRHKALSKHLFYLFQFNPLPTFSPQNLSLSYCLCRLKFLKQFMIPGHRRNWWLYTKFLLTLPATGESPLRILRLVLFHRVVI